MLRNVLAGDPRSEAEHICIIVGARELRFFAAMDDRRADAMKPVRGDRHADTGAADEHPAARLAVKHGATDGRGDTETPVNREPFPNGASGYAVLQVNVGR